MDKEWISTYWRKFHQNSKDYLLLIVLLVVCVALLLSVQSNARSTRVNNRLQENINCQQQVMSQLIMAIQARASAATDADQATTDMVQSVVDAKKAGDVSRALNTYLSARNAANASRVKNPLPAPPTQVCR